jgi:hypothetical protein
MSQPVHPPYCTLVNPHTESPLHSKIWKLGTMKLASVCWDPFASPDYIADVIFQKNNKPVVRDRSLHQSGGNPSFIVLHFKEVVLVRGFDSGKIDSSAPVVEMV